MEYNKPVIVPDLGCFTIVDQSAEIRNGVDVPAGKTVVLDCENADDDHVLTSYIAEKENITIEQAAEAIKKFYKQFFILVFGRTLQFEKFGTFLLNEKKDIIFAPDINFFSENLFAS